jgi:DNA primase
MNQNLDEYLGKLVDYLSKQDIHTNIDRYSQCPLKDHKSAKPFKLGIGTGGDPVWMCFACGEGGTIFDIAAALHGYPGYGDPNFYDITVRHLSDTLGLPFPKLDTKPLSPQEVFKKELYNLTREITNNLSTAAVKDYAISRGWNINLLKEFNIGCISNYTQLLDSFKSRYSDKALKTVGFISKYATGVSFFAEKRIIFTIHDSWGRPIGFTARLLDYSSGDPRKYINSAASPIFKKRNVLYNMHRARKALQRDESKILYLVEGQADALTLYAYGIKSVLAISGSAFTNEHMQEIKQFDLVVGCLDADLGGNRATRKLYSTYYKDTGKDLYLMMLPDGMDPDDFVRKEGIEKFLDIEPILPIEWEIMNEYVLRGKLLTNYWIPRIAKVNSLYHDKILSTLSIKSGEKEANLRNRLNNITLKMMAEAISIVSADNSLKLIIENKVT